MLLGFGKAGGGAWTLLLRHSDFWGRAAAWDAPLMMSKLGKYGSKPIFGTQRRFEDYRLSELLRTQLVDWSHDKQLIMTSYGGFRSDHQKMRELLTKSNIPHTYRDGPQRKHDWHSGWVEEAVTLLFEDGNKHGE